MVGLQIGPCGGAERASRGSMVRLEAAKSAGLAKEFELYLKSHGKFLFKFFLKCQLVGGVILLLTKGVIFFL